MCVFTHHGIAKWTYIWICCFVKSWVPLPHVLMKFHSHIVHMWSREINRHTKWQNTCIYRWSLYILNAGVILLNTRNHPYYFVSSILIYIITSPPIGGGRGIVMPMSVCVFVCVFVRVFAKFQSVISQPFLNRSRWNLVHTLVARRARSAISDCLVR